MSEREEKRQRALDLFATAFKLKEEGSALFKSSKEVEDWNEANEKYYEAMRAILKGIKLKEEIGENANNGQPAELTDLGCNPHQYRTIHYYKGDYEDCQGTCLK